MHRVADCIIRRVIPQPTEWQRIGDEINAAMIFLRGPAGFAMTQILLLPTAAVMITIPRNIRNDSETGLANEQWRATVP
jgi:hypothetical protein